MLTSVLPALLLALGPAPATVPQARLESALSQAVAAACPGKRFRFDADLTRAAAAFAEAVRSGRAEPGGEALSFFASLESWEPSPSCGVATIDQPAQADRAVDELFPQSCRFDRLGIAALTVAQDKAVVAVLAAQRTAELSPLRGQLAPGEQVLIAGRLADPQLTNPRLYHLKPDGEVDERPLQAAGGKRFAERLVLREVGEHSLEVLADGPGGPQVVALRRVFVGQAPPSAPPPAPPPSRGDPLDAVTRSINQLRRSRGLPALQRDQALDAVAEGHSREMARLRTFAHVLPTDGALGDRLAKAGYAYRSAGENIGLSEDAIRAHEAVAQSPAHLWNLLDPRHKRLGLGSVRAPSPEGQEAVWLTEVLALPVVGSTDPVGDVAKALQAARKKRGLPPLQRSRSLDDVAQHEVRLLALSGSTHLADRSTQKALDSLPGLQEVHAELAVVGAPDDLLTTSKNLSVADWRHIGVGALYASSAQLGPGRLWVLLFFAR